MKKTLVKPSQRSPAEFLSDLMADIIAWGCCIGMIAVVIAAILGVVAVLVLAWWAR
jgi:hypothetical protein